MTEVIINGVMLGLSTGISCLGYCSPLFVPYLLSEKTEFKTNVLRVSEFLSGRLLAYILWGFMIGKFSDYIESDYMKKVSVYAILFSSILLITYGMMKNFPQLKFCQKLEHTKGIHRFPLLLGITVGLNICPPFVMGISYLLNVGKVRESMIFFIFFFLGTSVYMIPYIFLNLFSSIERIQYVARVTAIVSGVWFFIYAITLSGW